VSQPPLDGLSELFWSVARKLRRHTRSVVEPYHLTPSMARALGVLSQFAPMRISALADHLRVAPRTATELVDELAGRNLADRHPDPRDRRAVLVILTDAGEEDAKAIRAAREAAGARFFQALNADDRRELGRILRKLND
jgi:DNA-binding MarR family transcriptional regulator